MTTKAQLRKAALYLPEVEEGTHFGLPAYKVRGKGFASLTEDGAAQLRMTEQDVALTVQRVPTAAVISRNGKTIGVSVPLADVDGMVLNNLVRKSWLSVAPKALANSYRAAAEGAAPSGPDSLPKAIGKPATQALLAAGVSSLSEVTKLSSSELLAMHGVGPKAVSLLEAELIRRGLALRS